MVITCRCELIRTAEFRKLPGFIFGASGYTTAFVRMNSHLQVKPKSDGVYIFECHPGERNIDGKKQHPVSLERGRVGNPPLQVYTLRYFIKQSPVFETINGYLRLLWRLDAFKGLILASATAAALMWVAITQWPFFHFKAGSGNDWQYHPPETSTFRLQPSQFSMTS